MASSLCIVSSRPGSSTMSVNSMDLGVNLNNLPIFQDFYNHVSQLGINKFNRRIFDIKNDLFYLCNDDSGDIYVTRASSFIKVDMDHRYQVYKAPAHNKVAGKVLDVKVGEHSDRVALVTDKGLYIASLPHVRTACMLTTVPYHNIYSVWQVEHPREYRMHSVFVYTVQRILWHPKLEDLLYVLFNDNYLRLYNVFTKSLLNIISLGCHPVHPLSAIYALEDAAVDFDFLPATDKKEENLPILVVKRDGSFVKTTIILNQCFDLACALPELKPVLNCCNNSNSFFFVDSMMVIHTEPITVVLTYQNTIQHCYLVQKEDDEFLMGPERFDVFQLNPSEDAHITMTLIKDPKSTNRYFLLHGYGLHAVLMPPIPYIISNALHNIPSLVVEELTTLVEAITVGSHVVYLVASTESCPLVPEEQGLFGVAILHDRTLSNTLIIMDPECCVVSLKTDELAPPPPIPPSTEINSPIKVETLLEKVYKILNTFEKRNTYFKYEEKALLAKIYGPSLDKPPEKVLEELQKLSSQLYAVHISAHEDAMRCIEAKSDKLCVEEFLQQKQLETFQMDKEYLTSNAERIAEKYEELKEKLAMQHKRFDMLNLKFQAPGKSLVEVKMRKEVEQCYEKFLGLQNALREAHQTINKMDMPRPSSSRKKPFYLDPETRKCVYRDLSAMYEQIKLTVGRIQPLLDYLNPIDENSNNSNNSSNSDN